MSGEFALTNNVFQKFVRLLHKFILVASVVVLLSTSARSAYISELYIAGSPQNHPDAVEISALSPSNTYELLVLDASPDTNDDQRPRTRIQQIFRFSSQGNSTLLLHEGPWNNTLYQTGTSQPITTLPLLNSAISGDTSFHFQNAHALVLMDRQTLLSAGVFFEGQHPLFLNGANILDVMTFSLSQEAWPLDDETVLDLDQGSVVSVATDPQSYEAGIALSGIPNELGHLTGAQGYRVTPGLANLTWSEPALPEPGTVVFVLAGAVILVTSRSSRTGK